MELGWRSQSRVEGDGGWGRGQADRRTRGSAARAAAAVFIDLC